MKRIFRPRTISKSDDGCSISFAESWSRRTADNGQVLDEATPINKLRIGTELQTKKRKQLYSGHEGIRNSGEKFMVRCLRTQDQNTFLQTLFILPSGMGPLGASCIR